MSFLQLQRTPPGFEAKGPASACVGVPNARYTTPLQQSEFFARVVDRLRDQPGVTDAAVSIGLPLSGFNPRSPYSVGGRSILPLPQRPIANLGIVSDGYFRLMRITLAAGRAFTADDRESAPGVCVVNESFAKRPFPGESPLLFNVQPLDPLVYGGVTALFTIVATLARLLPSLRASRIDPLLALRSD